MRLKVALGMLVLASLACGTYVTPTPTVPAPVQPTPTATATAQPTAIPTLDWGHAVQTSAVVLPYALNIRGRLVEGTPGPVTGKYLYVGDKVVILACEGSWCDIETQIAGERVTGAVWRGCLSNVAEALLCREAE